MQSIIVLKANQTAISILPTRGSKSILFILPAIIENTGISIIVIPFITLIDNLVTRAIDIGVDYIQYRLSISSGQEGILRAAQLIVISANIILSAKFYRYINRLLYTGLLQQIFIDKYYTVIIDISYCAKLSKLIGLRRFSCPLVLLIATLPIVLED